ncbi:MAG: PSD1 and planctomycete cytochrome C domain-containing protein [Fuerstiella sp.]
MRLLVPATWMLVCVSGLAVCAAPPSVRYATDIQPILAKNCFACHGADEAAREAQLRLDIPADRHDLDSAAARAVVPGDPGRSELMIRITSSDPDVVMPPPGSGHTLTKSEILLLRQWVEAGAEYEAHWSFVSAVRPSVPAVNDGGWCRNDVDRFVWQRLAEQGLSPSSGADPRTLVRRVYLDLTGLPPAPEAADAFARNPSPQAYEAMVDDLLTSPRFGERWAAMWLDLARYADTKGYEKDQPRNIWRYRDWVIDAFNRDMPFDQFTVEQIAGDLLQDATMEQRLATAFHRNTMTNDEGGTDNEEFRIAAVKDRVDTTVQVWMGLTMGCARCHSHKYDPISQQEYYRFMAFFNQTEDADRPDDSPRLPTPTSEQQHRQAELSTEITELQKRLNEITSERTDEQQQTLLQAFRAVHPTTAPLAKRLKEAEQQLAKLNADIVQTPVMRELPAARRRSTFVHVRGNFLEPGEEVQAGFPAAFGDPSGLGNRLAVAQWLVSDSNPLTARVMVNRVWSRFFGRGLVETEEDFGTQGGRPTHPQLLDWLAVEFRDTHRWSFKQLCRTIVMSATYQQSSVVTDTAASKDPQNRWLSRGARFRLSAEAVRDQALAAAGLLSDRIGGPSVMPPQPDGIWRTTYSSLKWQTPENEDRYRRGLYTFLRRTSPYPSMITFDGTSREVCQIRRIRTNTPLQALIIMNDPVYLEAAAALAESVGSLTDDDCLRQIFRRVLIRPPGDEERVQLQQVLADSRSEFTQHPEAAAKLLKAANRPAVPSEQRPELAALTVVASVVLNLDETVMRP